MHIVLYQPEIPANTGNIGRTCVASGTSLHLIEPLGFRINEKELKRAGMDYWDKLDVTRYMNFDEFRQLHPGARIWMATTKAKRIYTEADYGPDDYLMFGRESAGIPEEILVDYEEACIRIPMGPHIRSLNLANSVAVVLYEALRQNLFSGLERQGNLHRLHWKQDEERRPYMAKIHESAFIAQGAVVMGDVTVEENAGIWYHATVRGDRAPVFIGKGSNVQDNCVLHVEPSHPVVIGENVTIGHSAVVHGAVIGDNTLIGMGAILMNGCRIGKNCVIGAGALITQNTIIQDNSLVLGNPGRVKREVTPDEIKSNIRNAAHYVTEAEEYKNGRIK